MTPASVVTLKPPASRVMFGGAGRDDARAGGRRRGEQRAVEIGPAGDDEIAAGKLDARRAGPRGVDEARRANRAGGKRLVRERVADEGQRAPGDAAAARLLARVRAVHDRHARAAARERPGGPRTRQCPPPTITTSFI